MSLPHPSCKSIRGTLGTGGGLSRPCGPYSQAARVVRVLDPLERDDPLDFEERLPYDEARHRNTR